MGKKPFQPRQLNIKGELYKLVVFQVLTEDSQGQPKTLLMLNYKDTVHLNGGEKFVTAYMPECNLTT